MKILAIETSCDETAIAIVRAAGGLPALPAKRGERAPKFKVEKNIVLSQIKIHRPFGGVVPNLAKREHIKNLPKIFKTLNAKRFTLLDLDAVAVTVGPGLEPALWQGIEFAKQLRARINADLHADKRGKKQRTVELIGVNHMEGHLYSNWLPKRLAFSVKSNNKTESTRPLNAKRSTLNPKIVFPAVALVVSGGHTILLKMTSLTKWKKLGETRDDAAGEAYDKVARLLGLPYPGGPEIEKLAKNGNLKAINFPRPMLKDVNYDFSFSGLKTAVLYYLRDNPKAFKADVAANFQQAVIDVLVGKTMRAAEQYKARSVLLCGGVSANRTLRESLRSKVEGFGSKFFVPDFEYNTDNAAMIAAAAYIQCLRKKKLPLTANSNLNL